MNMDFILFYVQNCTKNCHWLFPLKAFAGIITDGRDKKLSGRK